MYAFIAHSAMILKGETIEFWEEELKDYSINDKCECDQCYTLYLTPPDDHGGAFARGYMSAVFENSEKNAAGIMVILHENENGHLIQLEIPSLCDVPFNQEYNTVLDDNYCTDTDAESARRIIAEWFASHPEQNTSTLIIND